MVVLACLSSLILTCSPQALGDDGKASDTAGVAGADGSAEVIGRTEERAGEERSIALEASEDTRGTGYLEESAENEQVMLAPEREVEYNAMKTDEGKQANPQDDLIICAFFMGNPKGAHLEQLRQMFTSARYVHGPKSRLMIVTDEESHFDIDAIHRDLEIMRFTIDEEKFKYNIGSEKGKNHLSLMPKRVAFESFLLERLHKEGNQTNVVFVDTDLLFLRSVADIFTSDDFDVAMTFRKPIPGRPHTKFLQRQEPVNLGIKFANGVGLAAAFAFWQQALGIWEKSSYAKCNDCDQQAFADAGNLASTDKRLRLKHPFLNKVSTDAGPARVRFVHCSYFNSYTSKGNCGPSSYSHVLHFKGDLKRWMPKVYSIIKAEVLAPMNPDVKVTATHSVSPHTVKRAASAYASFYKSSQGKNKRG